MQKHLKTVIHCGLFLIPFIPFLVSSALFFPFITTKAFAWRMIVEIIFAAWILLALLDVNYRPKRSIILYSIFSFLVIIGLADLIGVAPVKSFWSNFERMEGFITLLHLGMFFVVISSVFKEVDWKKWWNVSLAVSFLMVLYCLLQIIGLRTINQGGVRVEGTFGNAIYLAVYMLFHIFIALLFLWREWKNVALRWIYGGLIFAQAFVLYYSATRGAILGFLVGLFIIAMLNIRNQEDMLVRKASVATLVGLLILVSSFWAARNAEFVRGSPVLSRFSSLSTEELKTQGRYFIWPMALVGVKERPFLGWGQDNFNYVFSKYYNPQMFRLEPWFDRAHNTFLDWAVAGGIIGLFSYLSLYVALLFLIWNRQTTFSHTEKSILTGLVAAYFFHNFFVFDHLISYILFFSFLAYMHHRNSVKPLWRSSIGEIQVRSIVLPAVSILLISSLYFINIKPIIANLFLIKALQSLQTPGEIGTAAQYFKKAYSASRLGRPEVVEQIAANSRGILTSNLSLEEKNVFFNFAKDAVLGQVVDLKEDARYEILAGSFLSAFASLDEALVHLKRAQNLIPGKQQVYFEIGAAYINKGELLQGLEVFKTAYELAPEYDEAKIIYLLGAIYANDRILEKTLLAELPEDIVVKDSRILSARAAVGR